MRRISLLLTVLLLTAFVSGCISEGTQSPEGTNSTTMPTTTTPPAFTSTSTYSSPGRGDLELPEGNYTAIYTGLGRSCPTGRVPVRFVYNPGNETVKSVSLRGSFNNWAEWPMKEENGTWSTTVCLRAGKYEYKYFINGQWVKDMSDDGTGRPYDPYADGYADDGYGGKNAVRIVEGKASFYVEFDPGDPAYLSVADNRTVVRFEAKRNAVSSAVLVTDRGNYTMTLRLWWDSGEMWRGEIPFVEPVRYYIVINSADGERFAVLNTSESPFFSFDGIDKFPQLEWVSNGIAYQIFPDRFNNGNESNDAFALDHDELLLNQVNPGRPILSNWSDQITPLHCCHQYFGGDIDGITEKLDYLQSLGVTIIYLNPIFLSGSVHGYDTYDYYRLDPKFGTEEDLREFLDEAHRRGIRVIFDFVPNHCGIGNPAFLDVWKNGEKSPYWHWFLIKQWPFKLGDGDAYVGWWGIGSLPKLNTTNPEVREYLIGAALYWLDFGFDGIRVDVPNEVLDPATFFPELRERAKEKHPDAYIIGEIWTLSPEWVRGDRFDSLMNYALGRDILLNYAKGLLSGEAAMKMMGRYYASYGENVAAMGFNLVDSHDTSRVLTDLGGGSLGDEPTNESIRRLKLLSTLLYTLPGTPVTFQGDERGLLGDKNHYDEQRYPIQWGQVNEDVLDHYRALAELRESVPALRSSAIRFYTAKGGTMAFFRGHNDEVLVVVNSWKKPAELRLPPGEWNVVWPKNYTVSGPVSGTIEVPSVSVIVLERG
ncbi:alpha-amylase family glycosyl hydrolase [Thermococcus sp. 5-4]|uniref:alpha-amylase family glycosyl hydrolase n=1 Tax=Thermococcus sp. 5-4 TaxID=2008440 RepID=UPI000B4A4303|nr:alpha-amylase family glycosyl hydrolase [Thermococcus sp. 5-4]ASA77467.1 pullulanase [Thermococcus sp. 5-4]